MAGPTHTAHEDVRPWGRFERLSLNEPVTVKVITVEPGHRLSLQRHRFRDEWWQVLDPGLVVELDGRVWDAEVGERVWVLCGQAHRIANRGARSARFLELAFGDFDEDDIERLDDDYERMV